MKDNFLKFLENNNMSSTKSQLKITPGALVCNEAEILGDVSIGVKTVIHPKAKIIAEKGLINFLACQRKFGWRISFF